MNDNFTKLRGDPEFEARRLTALREAMARPRRQEWIDNQTAAIRKAYAEGRINLKRSPETIEKTAAKLRGRKRPPEVVEKVRQANLGKKRTPSMRQAQSERMRQAISEGRFKVPGPEELKQRNLKISQTKKARGYTPSIEQRQRHSAMLTGRKATPEHVEARTRPMRGRPQKAPLTKKGVTNHRSLEGILRSPENRLYAFRNLTQFVRDHPNLFLPEDVDWVKKRQSDTCRASKGLINLFGHGKHVNGSWKGWTIYSWTEHQFNAGRDLLDRPELLPEPL